MTGVEGVVRVNTIGVPMLREISGGKTLVVLFRAFF